MKRENTLKALALAGALVLALPAWSQLRSEGPMPEDLRLSVQQLYDTDLQRAKEYTGGRVRDRQQLLEASYNINKMLAGGHIIYGDPISRMLERIADTLLSGYPELRSELRFYTVTSPDVNAYATPQGMIFVNTGMVAQVEDEAQLAFIVAHEIVHYYRAHGLEELVGKDGKKRRRDNLDDEAAHVGEFLRYHNRSREMENEADSLGIAMFYLGSPYAKDVTEGVFDVLQYGELPFDELPFDTTAFNTPYYSVNGCWLDTVAEITSRDNYDDSHSTHPNILSRRQRTASALDGYYGGERYVTTSRTEFERLRHMARLECIRQDLLHGLYPRAYYNSWVLMQQEAHRDDPQMSRYMVQALYGAATFKNNDKKNDVLPDPKKVQGESQQVYHALREMNNGQATLAALHKAWEMHLRYPDDKAYSTISADLMEQLRLKLGMAAPDFLPEPPKAAVDSVEAAPAPTPEADKPKTKYERIKQKRQIQTERKAVSYALTDLMQADATLMPTLRSHLNGNAPKESITPATDDTAAMLIFNPCYWIVDSKKDQLQVNRSVSRENSLASHLERTARRFGRRAVDFSDNGMHAMESADQYNDFLTICEWMNEFWLAKGNFNLERTMQPAMDDLLERHSARTLNMAALLNVEGQDGNAGLGYAVLLPLAPIVIVGALTGHEQTSMVDLVVDAREGKLMTRESFSVNEPDASSMVDAMLYDTYRKAMNPGKKEPIGHMGHRMAITGGFNLGASGKQPWSQLDKYFALTPWAAVEFVVGRKTSIFASARYHKAYEGVTKTVGEWIEQGYSTTYNEYTVPNSYNMLTVTAGGRFYRESEFAPLGMYVSAAALLTHYSKAFDGTEPEIDNTFGIDLGLGQNFIYFGRLVLNYEVNYAWSFGYLASEMKNFSFENESKIKKYRADGLVSNLITFRLGIGFIPF